MAKTVIPRWAKIQSKLQLIASSVKLAECFNIRLESYKAKPKYVEVSCRAKYHSKKIYTILYGCTNTIYRAYQQQFSYLRSYCHIKWK
jgi:hypothetical protein